MLKHNTKTPFQSYKLSWIQNDRDLIVSLQVKVKPSLGHYDKNVLSHIVPVEACDILLEQPGHFNRTFVYHGYYNKITFSHRENKLVVSFSTLSQIVENQLQT